MNSKEKILFKIEFNKPMKKDYYPIFSDLKIHHIYFKKIFIFIK